MIYVDFSFGEEEEDKDDTDDGTDSGGIKAFI